MIKIIHSLNLHMFLKLVLNSKLLILAEALKPTKDALLPKAVGWILLVYVHLHTHSQYNLFSGHYLATWHLWLRSQGIFPVNRPQFIAQAGP